MDGHLQKKKLRMTSDDRISKLPDNVIHKILKFVDTKLAVQTSVLSKRWKLIWTTLPFLSFKWDQQSSPARTTNLTRHVLNHRNHRSPVSSLELAFAYFPSGLIEKFVEYAIFHNVKYLNVHFRHDQELFKLSKFSSNSIEKLELETKLGYPISRSDCWDLPALTTLRLKGDFYTYKKKLPERCLTCLPALRILCLENWDLQSFSFDLPALTSLHLFSCVLPKTIWNFPDLKSLTLEDVAFHENMSDIFPALVSLQNFKLCFYLMTVQDSFIHCPALVNLEMRILHFSNKTPKNNIVVSAPKLSTFTSYGIFPITFQVSKLDSVNIQVPDSSSKEYYRRFTVMLPGLGSTKILNLDSKAIEALSSISDYLVYFPSPFYNLKYVKLPKGCEEESISSTLRSYLLDGSPSATFLTTLQQNMIPHTEVAPVTAQNLVLQEPLESPTMVLVDSEKICKPVCTDTVDVGVKEEHVVQNSVVDVHRVRQIGAPVERTGNDQVSSCRCNSDFGLWRGHEVNSEFVCLLDLIMNKYPETFEHFTSQNKRFCTMKLNLLCTSVNDFTRISMTDVDIEMIAEYRDIFAELQTFGFNVSWLVSRLNYIEQVRFSQPLLSELHAIDCHIDDAKSKLQDLETLRAKKMQEIQKAFGIVVTNLLVGYIGDDLLSSP